MRGQRIIFSLFIALAAMAAGCGGGGSEEAGQTDDRKLTGDLAVVNRLASQGMTIEGEGAWVKDLITGGGYKVKSYSKFAGQPNGKDGRMLIYTDAEGKSGGFIYMLRAGNAIEPAWHWYFDDLVPDDVTAVELNDDGLWDIRMVAEGGQEFRFIQGESFTLMGRGRGDWIALNGVSSPPTSMADAMWRCFDSDSSTAWRSQTSGGKAYVEIPAPFGVQKGVLSVTGGDEGQPRSCTVYADGKRVQDVELEPTTSRQLVQLDEAIQGAKMVRIEIESAHGGQGAVAISELSLQ